MNKLSILGKDFFQIRELYVPIIGDSGNIDYHACNVKKPVGANPLTW